jgi:hypothetical protein
MQTKALASLNRLKEPDSWFTKKFSYKHKNLDSKHFTPIMVIDYMLQAKQGSLFAIGGMTHTFGILFLKEK